MVLDISLGAGVPRLVSGLGTSFLPLCLFGFEVLRGPRACSVGVLHFLRFPLLSYLALHTSMGLGRSSVLRIDWQGVRQFGYGGSPSCSGGASFPLG